MPVGYDTPRKLVALAGVGCLNLNLVFIAVAALVLGYLAFGDK